MRAVVVDVTAMPVAEAVVLQLATQNGAVAYAELKVIAQLVTTPVPTVMVPRVSFPEIDGLTPQVPAVAAAPELATWPVTSSCAVGVELPMPTEPAVTRRP